MKKKMIIYVLILGKKNNSNSFQQIIFEHTVDTVRCSYYFVSKKCFCSFDQQQFKTIFNRTSALSFTFAVNLSKTLCKVRPEF